MNGNDEPVFGCKHCQMKSSCPMSDGETPLPPEAQGFQLVSSAMVVFLLPLAMAILGAFLAVRWWARSTDASEGTLQAAGMAAGLIVGVVLAKLLIALRDRSKVCSGRGDV